MKKLILVSGPAGIGKSTWSKNYASSHPEEKVIVIAADEIRKAMCGGYDKFPENNNMMLVYDEMIRVAKEAAESHKDVTILFDTTMLYDERRLYFRRQLQGFDEYELFLLKLHDYNQCLIRNKKRPMEKWVPEDVIKNMVRRYADPSPYCKLQFDHVEEIYVD